MSLAEGTARKDAGRDRVEGTNTSWVKLMRSLAERIAISRGEVFIDDLRRWADENGCPPESFCNKCPIGTCERVHSNAWGAIFKGPWEQTGEWRNSTYSSNHAHRSPVWRFVAERKKPVDAKEWRGLIDYWTGDGHDIKHLHIPLDVANELGIELPEEENMTDETQADPISDFNQAAADLANPQTTTPATTEPAENFFDFKKKKYFDGTACGLRGCSKKLPVEGSYVSGTKPTKGDNGRLWYGPACEKCVIKTHTTGKQPSSMRPDTLAQLAHQRNGASDLALILDCEVGDVHKRLAAAGIDEHGQPLGNGVPTEHVGPVVTDCTVMVNGTPLADTPSPQLDANGIALTGVAPMPIPTEQIATASHEIQATLVFLGTFHIQTQVDMDSAGAWLQTVKSKWKDLDELRKALGKPYRDKTTEIQTHFNPILETLKQAEGILKQKISEGEDRATAAQQQALQQAQAAHAAGNMQAAGIAAQTVAQTDVTLPHNVSQRPNTVKYEVFDATQVPAEFWSIDPVKIQAFLAGGGRLINGVRIWEEPSLASRAS